MKTLNFINGYYLKNNVQVNLTGFMIFMMTLISPAFAEDANTNQKLEPLDQEMLEFLSLYEPENADLFDIAMEEVSLKKISREQSVSQTKEAE